MPVEDRPAAADNTHTPSTSGTHLPAPAGLPDESPPREPATAPGDLGAQLARLGDRIAELFARIQAAAHELLVLIREFDEQDGWHGCLSCAQWLSWRAGLSPGSAREHVRVARALGNLPKLSDAMRRGKVSCSKVRAVTRVAIPENEQTLLDVALAGTAAHVERIARAWRRIDRNVEQAEEQQRNASRELRTWVDENGMVVVRGRLTPEVGSVLRRALEAACDQARRGPESDGGAEVEAADASAGVKEEATDAASDAEEPTFVQRQAHAIGTVAEAALAGGLDRGTAGDRYQVVLHVDTEALAKPRYVPAGTSVGAASGSEPRAGGDRVPAGTSATTRVASGGPGDESSIHPEALASTWSTRRSRGWREARRESALREWRASSALASPDSRSSRGMLRGEPLVPDIQELTVRPADSSPRLHRIGGRFTKGPIVLEQSVRESRGGSPHDQLPGYVLVTANPVYCSAVLPAHGCFRNQKTKSREHGELDITREGPWMLFHHVSHGLEGGPQGRLPPPANHLAGRT